MARERVSKYVHQSPATTAMPKIAATTTDQVSGRPATKPGPRPNAMIDSPSATRTISACRSAQWPAETTVHPVPRSTTPSPYSTASAAVHSPSRTPTVTWTPRAFCGSSAAAMISPVATTTGTASTSHRRRRAGSWRDTQPKIPTWDARTRK